MDNGVVATSIGRKVRDGLGLVMKPVVTVVVGDGDVVVGSMAEKIQALAPTVNPPPSFSIKSSLVHILVKGDGIRETAMIG